MLLIKEKDIKDEYKYLWEKMDIVNRLYPTVSFISLKMFKLGEVYKKIFPNIPFFIIGFLHYQNNDFSFYKHLHNDDSLEDRTVSEPIGRPKDKNPPFTWKESAEDYISLISPIPEEITISNVLFFIEKLENFKYKRNNVISPTLWYGSNIFEEEFKKNIDFNKKIGIAPIIRYLSLHDIINIPV